MSHLRRPSLFVVCLLVLGAAPVLEAGPPALRIEVSPDGQQVVVLEPSPTDSLVTTRGGAPFGTTPDWQNNLRRQVSSLEIGDLNNDGWNDLAVGCYSSQSFPPYTDWENLIYYNTGSGTLPADPSWVSTDEVSTSDIKLGRLNADAYLDIFAGNGAGLAKNVIYFGGPAGPSPTPGWISNEPINCWTNAVTLFDIDHDGDLDVFTGNQGVSPTPFRRIYGFRNDGGVVNPTPYWQSDDESITGGVDFADYDGDGWEDLAVSKWTNGHQSGVYKSAGGTLQTLPVWTTGQSSTERGARWSDLDGNGWPDLVIGHGPPQAYYNTNGILTLTWTAQTNSSAPQDMRLADVDRDGDDDFVEIQFSTGMVRLHMNNGGALETVPSWTYDSPGAGSALAVGDLNGDNFPDLAVGNSGQPCIFIFFGQGPALCPGDMHCDGVVDFDDIDLFVEALGYSGPANWPHNCAWLNADCDASGAVTFDDIDPFVARIGLSCP